MMKIGGRVGFDKIVELETNFKAIDFSIELALPWKYQDLWLPLEDKIKQIIDFFKRKNISILSFHATQGKITNESFLRWGKITIDIARSLGVKNITIHPDNIRGQRTMYQEKVLKYINKLGGSDIFSIETFCGKRRIFSPAELVEQGIPMTLDTAHIHDRKKVLNIINTNHCNIKTVHLSAIGKKEHHLPIDDFCISVVDQLIKLKWHGDIILEYLPWHHYRVRDDIRALKNYIDNNTPLKLLPVSDRFKGDLEHYGYNTDGTN